MDVQDDEAESAYSGLQSYFSGSGLHTVRRLHTNSSNSSILSGSRSVSCQLTDMTVCDVDRTRGVFDCDSDPPASSQSESDDASGVVFDKACRNENIGPPRPEVVSSRDKRTTWYCTHAWYMHCDFNDETEIGRFIRNQFLDKKPDKFDLKYLAIAYDSSGLIWPDQFIERLQVTCYLSVASRHNGVNLARLDHLEFTVFESSGFLLNLAYLDSGLELNHVMRIVRERGKYKAIYFRVLRTELAIEESEEDDWNTSETTQDGGLRRISHWGKKQRLLALEHTGDAKF